MDARYSTFWVFLCMALATTHCTAAPLVVNQLDVCNRHSSATSMPSMSLSVNKADVCTLATRLIASGKASCPISNKDPALVLQFPCQQTSRSIINATGPAVNIWSSVTGPTPGNSQSSLKNLCNLSTFHPSLYFHRVPPTYYFGYQLDALPCNVQAATPGVLPNTGTSAAGSSYALSYGLWLVPSLKYPPSAYPKEAQNCRVAVLLPEKAYLSTTSYACKLLEWTPKQTAALGRGCCYDAI